MSTARVIVLFVLAATAQIGGSWLIWQAVREGRAWWWDVLGALVALVGVAIIMFAPHAREH